jgi:hypothetical protein
MGYDKQGHAFAKRNIDAWIAEMDGPGLDAIVITASGCGTTIKDYGFMFRDDPAYATKAKRVSELAKDITEYALSLKLMAPVRETDLVVAYHSACSMQHGQQIRTEPKTLLKQAGFTVKDVPEGPYLLRLGRHLQPAPARDRGPAAGAQSRQHRGAQARPSSPTANRLHDADREGHAIPIVHTWNCSIGPPAGDAGGWKRRASRIRVEPVRVAAE